MEGEREKLLECDAVFCADDLAHILPIIMDVAEDAQDVEISERESRNSHSTANYMTLFGVQIIMLYSCIATIFVRSKTLRAFIRMIGGMFDERGEEGHRKLVQERANVQVEQLVVYQVAPMAVGCADAARGGAV